MIFSHFKVLYTFQGIYKAYSRIEYIIKKNPNKQLLCFSSPTKYIYIKVKGRHTVRKEAARRHHVSVQCRHLFMFWGRYRDGIGNLWGVKSDVKTLTLSATCVVTTETFTLCLQPSPLWLAEWRRHFEARTHQYRLDFHPVYSFFHCKTPL